MGCSCPRSSATVHPLNGFAFGIISDPHIGYKRGGSRLKSVVRSINAYHSTRNLDFVVVLGDIAHSGLQSQMQEAHRILEGLSCPFYAVIGNHDTQNQGRDEFVNIFGDHMGDERDTNYTFLNKSGDVAFVVLDYTDSQLGDTGAYSFFFRHFHHGGDANPEAVKHLQDVVAAFDADKKIRSIVLLHHHPYRQGVQRFRRAELERLSQTFQGLPKKKLWGCIAGHIHENDLSQIDLTGFDGLLEFIVDDAKYREEWCLASYDWISPDPRKQARFFAMSRDRGMTELFPNHGEA